MMRWIIVLAAGLFGLAADLDRQVQKSPGLAAQLLPLRGPSGQCRTKVSSD